MSVKRQSMLCGPIGFIIHETPQNDKINEGYTMIQGNDLQIMHNGTQLTFNLDELLSSFNLGELSSNPENTVLKYKYNHNLSFTRKHQKSNDAESIAVDIYTNDISFYQSFSDIIATKWEQLTIENQNKEEKKEQKEESVLECFEVYQIPCEGLCGAEYDAEQLFICCHTECENVKQKFLCAECGLFSHKSKSHSFCTDNIGSVEDVMLPDDDQFGCGVKQGTILKRFNIVKKILFRQRWLSTTTSSLCVLGGATSAGFSILRDGAPSIFAASTEAHKVVTSALGPTAIGGGIGAIVGIAIEGGYIFRQLYKKRISNEEAVKLGIVAVTSNAVSVGTYVGCMAVGAAVGAPGGPVGWIIGAIAGAVVCSIGTRYFLNKACEKYFKEKHAQRTELQREALAFFFGDKKYDINDDTLFNEKIVRRRYRRLAVICHPDTKDGDYQEWLKLSAFYGILTAIIEEKEEDIKIEAMKKLKTKSITLGPNNNDETEEKNEKLEECVNLLHNSVNLYESHLKTINVWSDKLDKSKNPYDKPSYLQKVEDATFKLNYAKRQIVEFVDEIKQIEPLYQFSKTVLEIKYFDNLGVKF